MGLPLLPPPPQSFLLGHLLKPHREPESDPGPGLEPACGQSARLGAPLGLPVGLIPLPQSSPGKAEVRRACPEHFRAAMTSVFVPKINAPQTRQCGQGLRSYCKYQPRASYFCFSDSLWGRRWPAPF